MLRVAYSHKEHLKGFTPVRGGKNREMNIGTHVCVCVSEGTYTRTCLHTHIPLSTVNKAVHTPHTPPGLSDPCCSFQCYSIPPSRKEDALQQSSSSPPHQCPRTPVMTAAPSTALYSESLTAPPHSLGSPRAQTLSTCSSGHSLH